MVMRIMTAAAMMPARAPVLRPVDEGVDMAAIFAVAVPVGVNLLMAKDSTAVESSVGTVDGT